MTMRLLLLLSSSALVFAACASSTHYVPFEGTDRTHEAHVGHCSGLGADRGDAPSVAATRWKRRAQCFLATPTSYPDHLNDHAEGYAALGAHQASLARGATSRDVRCVHLEQAIRHEMQCRDVLNQYFLQMHEAIKDGRASGPMGSAAADDAEKTALPAIQERMKASEGRREALTGVATTQGCLSP